jgi:ABC-type nitrate/sulfonate/bicarbonate transport system permease component
VVLPAALPRLFLGVRIGAAAAALGLLAVETFGAADVLVLATVALLGVLTLGLVRGLERRVLAWR